MAAATPSRRQRAPRPRQRPGICLLPQKRGQKGRRGSMRLGRLPGLEQALGHGGGIGLGGQLQMQGSPAGKTEETDEGGGGHRGETLHPL